jgi:hypothetical protein
LQLYLSRLAFSAAFKALFIRLSRSLKAFVIGFHANRFRMNNNIENDSIIQKKSPKSGITNPISYKFSGRVKAWFKKLKKPLKVL